MTRIRMSDSGKDRNWKRKSRAGETSPTGNYVRRRAVQMNRVVNPGDEPEERTSEHEVQPERKAVTLPPLKFLQKKCIAGELI